MQSEVNHLAQIVWDYHHLGHPLRPADGIVVLGSHDLRVAHHGARLVLDGLAPWIVFSGGLGNLTAGKWNRPEADLFADEALAMGVPPDAIYRETASTNTGENITLTDKLIAHERLTAKRLILVQKPYMERRTLATARVHWPDKDLLVTSPPFTFQNYPNEEISREDVIHIMIGDLQRIREYPRQGYQVPMPVPDTVRDAYLRLTQLGFTRHLIPHHD